MLIESTAHLPISLAMLDGVFNSPDGAAIARMILRWSHFVAGITWIGLLYFFNLVNVPVQKGLDAETKKKVNPDLLGRALWYFRWGAVVTVLAGLTYYAMYILSPDVKNANTLGGGNINVWIVLLSWLTYPLVLFGIEFLIIKKVPALTKDGRLFAVVMFLLVAFFTWGLIKFFTGMLSVNGESFASNKAYSIGIGGAYGILMMLNVWGSSGLTTNAFSRQLREPARRRRRACTPGISRVENKHVAVTADVVLHGHFARRLGNPRKIKALAVQVL